MIYSNKYLLSEKEVGYIFDKLHSYDGDYCKSTGFNANLEFSTQKVKDIISSNGFESLDSLINELKRVN